MLQTTLELARLCYPVLPKCYLKIAIGTQFVRAKLTVRSVEAVVPGAKDSILWDTELSGFGCKVTPKGKRSYFLYYRTKDGQQRRPMIGQHGPLRPEAAREIARAWLAEVAKGNDPSQNRVQNRVAPTLRAVCDRYLSEHASARKKASSIRNDKRLIEVHLVPALGSRKVAAVTRPEIAALHNRLRRTPYEANRMLALASKIFGLTERWGLRPDGSNPAKNVDRFPEHKRERYLTSSEIGRLWRVLESEEALTMASPAAISAVKLLILTGRRLNEVLTLEWAWIDLEAQILRLPDTKSGALTVSLNDSAIALLGALRVSDPDGRFVIPGKRHDRPLVNLQKPWQALRNFAGLADVRLHDLRHTFASVGAGLGMSLPLLGRLLGHTQPSTTARYSHLALDPVKVAANAIGAEFQRLVLLQANSVPETST